jgi:predicted transglutaminase-like cysteine proteinase
MTTRRRHDHRSSLSAVSHQPAALQPVNSHAEDMWPGSGNSAGETLYYDAVNNLRVAMDGLAIPDRSTLQTRADLRASDIDTQRQRPDAHGAPNFSSQFGARAPLADSAHRSGVDAAYIRHRNSQRPDLNLGDGRTVSWDQFAAMVAAQPDFQKKLDMVNSVMAINMRYKPEGKENGWVSSPAEALIPGNRANCREAAVAKMFMLRDAGVPASQLAVATFEAGHGYMAHVVTAVKDDTGRAYVLDMGRVNSPYDTASTARVISVDQAARERQEHRNNEDPLHMLDRSISMITPMSRERQGVAQNNKPRPQGISPS